MSDLDRLVDAAPSDVTEEDAFLHDLLTSAKDDVPDAARRAATLSALSPDVVGEPAKSNTPVTVPPPEKAAATPSSTTTSAAAAGATTSSSTTLGWVVIVGLAAGALAVGLYATAPAEKAPVTAPTSAPVIAPTSATASPPIATTSPTTETLAAPTETAAAPKASAPSERVVVAPTPASAAAPVVAPLGLAGETAILDRARTALNGGNPRGALSELDRYDAAPGPKILGQEATMVRIEALSAKGDTAAARALGQSFLQKNPGSTYDDRVRALISEPKK